MSATDRPLDSLPELMARQASAGFYPIGWNLRHTPSTTTNTAAVPAGGNVFMALDRDRAAPPIGAAYRGWVVGACRGMSAGGHLYLMAKFLIGTLNFTGGAGTYVPNAAMPNRYHYGRGLAEQVIPDFSFLRVATTVVGAVTPTITLPSYTNEKAQSGRACSMQIPSNPVKGSVYALDSNLQGDDRAITDVAAMATSGGSAGAIEVWGCKEIAYEIASTSGGAGNTQAFQPASLNQPIMQPGDLYHPIKGTITSIGSFIQYDLVPILL